MTIFSTWVCVAPRYLAEFEYLAEYLTRQAMRLVLVRV